MYSRTEFEKFAKYIIFFPDEDDPDFDGEHYGGIKGLSDEAPEEARIAFESYMKELKKAQKESYKI